MKTLKYGEISYTIKDNIQLIKKLASDSADLVIREIDINGISCATVAAEGMVNSFYFSSIITYNLCNTDNIKSNNSEKLYSSLFNSKIISPDQKEFYTIDDLFTFIYSGFGVILVDGINKGIAFGAQGFSFRSINNPSSDENIKGSKEGFTEAIKINQSMIRRRIKSPELVFESIQLGNNSKTECALVYMTNMVSQSMLKKIRNRLSSANIDMVLESGSIKMLLTEKPLSLFSEIGSTERPDTLAKKVYEGKIGIIIDGTPFALIVPFLFVEHFHSLDDFEYKALFSNFIRFLKYSAFVISVLLPGVYVAVATYHPYIFSSYIQENIANAASATPYSFLVEAILIHFSYEIMREAGLRLPKEIGHAVSIVGGLIIGDAAITAGIASAPMVIIAALSAISAFVVPALMDSLVILRFLNIFLGGFLGMYGIALGTALICMNICAKTVYGVPYSSSISPSSLRTLSSFLYKSPKQQFASPKVPKITNMPGAKSSADTSLYQLSSSEKLSGILLSISTFIASIFSLWVYTKYLCSIIMPVLNPILAPIPLLLLLMVSKSCSTEGTFRTAKLFLFFFSITSLIFSFYMIFSGITAVELINSLSFSPNLWGYLGAELIILILFIPLCLQKRKLNSLGIITALSLLSYLMLLGAEIPVLSGFIPFTILFFTGLEFIKLLYVTNIINDTAESMFKPMKNLKIFASIVIFILSAVLIMFLK